MCTSMWLILASALNTRISKGAQFPRSRSGEASYHRCSQDFSGHGTHSAATVGGKKYGVAKSSTLHSVKILNAKGQGKMSYLIQALDWVATRGKRPSVFV